MGVLGRHILVRCAVAVATAAAALSLLAAAFQVLRLADPGELSGGLAPAAVGWALVLAMPPLVGLMMPVAALFAGLWVGSAAAAERAPVALSQAGLSPGWALRAPLAVGLSAALVAAPALHFGEPWGLGGLRRLTLAAAADALTQGASLGRPMLLGDRLMVGVPPAGAAASAAPPAGRLWWVAQRWKEGPRPPGEGGAAPPAPEAWSMLVARHGEVMAREAGDAGRAAAVLRLRDGLVWSDTAAGPVAWRARFDHAHVPVDLGAAGTGRRGSVVAAQGMTAPALRALAADPGRSRSERAQATVLRHRRLSLPVSAPLFMLLGVRLGTAARARGLALSLGAGVVVAYYNLGRAAELASRAGSLSPVLAAWSATLALAVLVALAGAAGALPRAWPTPWRAPPAARGAGR